MSKCKMRVAVIGAGAAGLCAARHALQLPQLSQLAVFESAAQVGGTWVYSSDTHLDRHGRAVHSSMYRDMLTNLPKEIMGFPDFPFPPNSTGDSFISHKEVLRYLQEYAVHYDLLRHIKFGHVVESARMGDEGCWSVCVRQLSTGEQTTLTADVLFVCNGHYSQPSMPDLDGLHKFGGRVLHSHHYRTKEWYAGGRVAVLGAGPSGTDIAVELSSVCERVFLCHNHAAIDSPLPRNLSQTRAICRVDDAGDAVHLDDGRVLADLHAVVLCTGYEYAFPFLDYAALPLSVDANRITPLFQHVLHVHHPRALFFIGFTFTILPFPNFDVQCRYAAAILSGRCEPPPSADMYQWQKDDFERRTGLGLPQKYAHRLGSMQWDYYRDLARLGNFANPVTPAVEQVYDMTHAYRMRDLVNYKKARFELLDEKSFRSSFPQL